MKRAKKRKTKFLSLAGQAQEHQAEAIAVLVGIVLNTKNDAARLVAATMLLDRGFGRSPGSLPIATKEPIKEPTAREIEKARAMFQKLRSS
jgi:hypothetical protein